jgi:hypothetical protein
MSPLAASLVEVKDRIQGQAHISSALSAAGLRGGNQRFDILAD